MKVLYLLLTSTLIVSIITQDCNNPLLYSYGFTGLLNPVSGANLPYCSELQADQTCCSVETVQNFQTNYDALLRRLQTMAGERDLYLARIVKQQTDYYKNLVNDLNDYDGEIEDLKKVNQEIGDEVQFQYDLFNVIKDDLGNPENEFAEKLREYQRLRVACFATVLNIQISAWCLSCDPNYASNGVTSDGSIEFSPSLCQTISKDCYPFMKKGIELNSLIRAQQSIYRLANLRNYLQDYHDGDKNVLPNLYYSGDFVKPTNATERTVTLPLDCEDENNCLWQCQNLFYDNGLNETILANGAGLIGGDDLDLAPIGIPSAQPSVVVATSSAATAIDTTTAANESEVINETETDVNEANINGNNRRVLQQDPTGESWSPNLEGTGFALGEIQADPSGVTGLHGDGQDQADSSDDSYSPHLSGTRLAVSGILVVSLTLGVALI